VKLLCAFVGPSTKNISALYRFRALCENNDCNFDTKAESEAICFDS